VASDGADNAELSQGVLQGAGAELRRLNAPVFVLPVGAQALRDLAVERVAVDDFAFVRNQVTVDVVVTARGFSSTEVPVVLKREGQVFAQKTVHIDGSRSRYEVKLSFVPDRTGKFAFTVSVPSTKGRPSRRTTHARSSSRSSATASASPGGGTARPGTSGSSGSS